MGSGKKSSEGREALRLAGLSNRGGSRSLDLNYTQFSTQEEVTAQRAPQYAPRWSLVTLIRECGSHPSGRCWVMLGFSQHNVDRCLFTPERELITNPSPD